MGWCMMRATRQGDTMEVTWQGRHDEGEGNAWQWAMHDEGNTTEPTEVMWRGRRDNAKATRWGPMRARVTRDEEASRRACGREGEWSMNEKQKIKKDEPVCASRLWAKEGARRAQVKNGKQFPPPCVCRREGGPMHLLREQKGQQEWEKKRREKKERYYKKKRWHIPTTLAGRGVHPRERWGRRCVPKHWWERYGAASCRRRRVRGEAGEGTQGHTGERLRKFPHVTKSTMGTSPNSAKRHIWYVTHSKSPTLLPPSNACAFFFFFSRSHWPFFFSQQVHRTPSCWQTRGGLFHPCPPRPSSTHEHEVHAGSFFVFCFLFFFCFCFCLLTATPLSRVALALITSPSPCCVTLAPSPCRIALATSPCRVTLATSPCRIALITCRLHRTALATSPCRIALITCHLHRTALATSPCRIALITCCLCCTALAMSPPSHRPVVSPSSHVAPRHVSPLTHITLHCVTLAMLPLSRRPIATCRPPPHHVAQAARLTGLGSVTEMEGCEWVGWKCESRVDYLVVNLVDCLCSRLSIQSNPFLIFYQSDF